MLLVPKEHCLAVQVRSDIIVSQCLFINFARIASGGWDKRLIVWDIQTGTMLVKLYYCHLKEPRVMSLTCVSFFQWLVLTFLPLVGSIKWGYSVIMSLLSWWTLPCQQQWYGFCNQCVGRQGRFPYKEAL